MRSARPAITTKVTCYEWILRVCRTLSFEIKLAQKALHSSFSILMTIFQSTNSSNLSSKETSRMLEIRWCWPSMISLASCFRSWWAWRLAECLKPPTQSRRSCFAKNHLMPWLSTPRSPSDSSPLSIEADFNWARTGKRLSVSATVFGKSAKWPSAKQNYPKSFCLDI